MHPCIDTQAKKFIHIDIDPAEIDKNIAGNVSEELKSASDIGISETLAKYDSDLSMPVPIPYLQRPNNIRIVQLFLKDSNICQIKKIIAHNLIFKRKYL